MLYGIARLASALLCCCALVTAAHAEESPREKARALFKEGEALYSAGDYHMSIDRYQRAYQLAPLPLLLFDLAQAHRQLGNRGEALKLYRQYLAADPSGRAATEANQHISALTASLAANPEAPAVEKPAVAAAPTPLPAPIPAVAPILPRPRPLRLAGWSLLASGVAVAGIGGVFTAQAMQANREFLQPSDGIYNPSAERDRGTWQNLAAGFYVIGGVMTVSGATLLVVDALRHRRAAEPSAR